MDKSRACRRAVQSEDVLYLIDDVILLSLDVTQYLVSELDIQHFYSDKLREFTRGYVAAVMGENEDFYAEGISAFVEVIPEPFLSKMSEELGPEVVSELMDWHRSRYTLPTAEVKLGWRFRELAKRWDDEAREDEVHTLPLSSPEFAHVRMILRDYAAHNRHLRLEVRYLSRCGLTEWDKKVDDYCSMIDGNNIYYVDTYVKNHLEVVSHRNMIRQLKQEVTEDQWSSLLSWIQTI